MKGSYNISTAVAIVSAACGVKIAKHGNYAISSKSGAANVLEKLGAHISLPKEALEIAIDRINFAFLMAPNHHPAMKNVAAIRKKIGVKTIFNLLGPLTNPAGAKQQLVGVYDKKWVRPIAEVLKNLGTERAWVVSGEDGMDEITLTSNTYVAKLENGKITEEQLSPADFDLLPCKPEDLLGGDAEKNAQALRKLLNGEKSPYRDIVLANTAAVLKIHDSASDLKAGVQRTAEVIDSGAANKTLNDYITFSNTLADQ